MSIYGELESERDSACTGCDCLSGAEKVTQTSMQTNTPKTYYGRFKFYIMLPLPQISAQECSKGLYCQCKVGSRTVGCCEHIAAVLWYPSYQRNQTGKVLSETDYCGTVNVLGAADTDQDPKCRVNESLYARRVSDFSYKVPRCINICFNYFHNSFLLIKVDFYDIKIQILYIFIKHF